MRVLVDTNIILDSVLEREPFADDADALFDAIEYDRIVGYAAATTLTNIFYIVRKQARSIERARQAVSETLDALEICAVDSSVLEAAFASPLRDFEDAVQLACALDEDLDAIVTRDARGFVDAPLPVLSVAELLERLG
ncbi:MAG: PIN domain-containing protein [Oscillatoria sp. SIO1A7]|nr:PIN domain-containing protein [Oscillatoria sp. SIO1A7]